MIGPGEDGRWEILDTLSADMHMTYATCNMEALDGENG